MTSDKQNPAEPLFCVEWSGHRRVRELDSCFPVAAASWHAKNDDRQEAAEGGRVEILLQQNTTRFLTVIKAQRPGAAARPRGIIP